MNGTFAYVYDTIFQFFRAGFSEDLYSESMYGLIGSVAVGWAVLMAVMYYFVILAKRSDTWARWYWWLLFGVLAAGIPPFVFTWLHVQGDFEGQGLTYETGDYVAFGFYTGLLAVLAYIIISNLPLRWLTKNGSSVPFPS